MSGETSICTPLAVSSGAHEMNGNMFGKKVILSTEQLESMSPPPILGPIAEQGEINSGNETKNPPNIEESGDLTSLSKVNKITAVQKTWLMAACECDYPALSRLAQEHPTLLESRSFIDGNTALHYAAKFGDVACVKLLVGTYKANVNAINFAGESALHTAYYYNRAEVCNLLESQYRADKQLFDYSGYLPKDHRNKRIDEELRYSLCNSAARTSSMMNNTIVSSLPRRRSSGGGSGSHLGISISTPTMSYMPSTRGSVMVHHSAEPGGPTYSSLPRGSLMLPPGSPSASFHLGGGSGGSSHSHTGSNKSGGGLSLSTSFRRAKDYLRGTLESKSSHSHNSSSSTVKQISSPMVDPQWTSPPNLSRSLGARNSISSTSHSILSTLSHPTSTFATTEASTAPRFFARVPTVSSPAVGDNSGTDARKESQGIMHALQEEEGPEVGQELKK